MVDITFDSAELRKLQADLAAGHARVGKEVAEVTRKNGQRLLDATKAKSPVRTGELRGSWQMQAAGDGRSGGMSASVRSGVRQAFFQEHGTSKMAAQPSAGPALDEVAPQYMEDMGKVGEKLLE